MQPSPSLRSKFLFVLFRRSSSAQLEPGGRLDGVQQFVPHQVLVAELWQLEQVHAGAGGGQALQVVAAVVDAEDRVKLLLSSSKKKEVDKLAAAAEM